jgi:hypothetical protein
VKCICHLSYYSYIFIVFQLQLTVLYNESGVWWRVIGKNKFAQQMLAAQRANQMSVGKPLYVLFRL